jgi:hypothetical protein
VDKTQRKSVFVRVGRYRKRNRRKNIFGDKSADKSSTRSIGVDLDEAKKSSRERIMKLLGVDIIPFNDGGEDAHSKGEDSPDRMDALVWALTELQLSGNSEPRIRGI